MIHAIDEHLKLTEVETTDPHISALYDLLCKRPADQSISHAGLPSRGEHGDFVKSHPYRHWFLLSRDDRFVGTVYMTNENTLGVFVEDDHLPILAAVIEFVVRTFDPLPAIPSIRNAAFVMNLSPENERYAETVERLGGRLIQKSYVLPGAADTDSHRSD